MDKLLTSLRTIVRLTSRAVLAIFALCVIVLPACFPPGEIKLGESTVLSDADSDGYAEPDDCDDSDPSVHPRAPELCDELDNDCDGATDEEFDADGDGFLDAAQCSFGDDCDDADASIHPYAPELCDGADNDCNGSVDDVLQAAYFLDADSDGYGNPDEVMVGWSCDEPTSGYVANNSDCDDSDASVNPDAAESCDGADEDCDGTADDDVDCDSDGYTADVDCDDTNPEVYPGFDNDGDGSDSCVDCDDDNTTVYPGAPEVCDDLDNACDGTADDGATDESTWYLDADLDGYGVETSTTTSCEAPTGYAEVAGDCDDFDASVNPGADEVYGNSTDEDCDDVPEIWYIDGTTLCVSDLFYSCWEEGNVYIIGESPFSWTILGEELENGAEVSDMWCWDPAPSYAGTPRNYEISFISEFDITDSTCTTAVDAGDRSTWYPASYEGIDDYCIDYGADDPETLCHYSVLMPSLYGEVYSIRFYYDGASTMYGTGTP